MNKVKWKESWENQKRDETRYSDKKDTVEKKLVELRGKV